MLEHSSNSSFSSDHVLVISAEGNVVTCFWVLENLVDGSIIITEDIACFVGSNTQHILSLIDLSINDKFPWKHERAIDFDQLEKLGSIIE